MLPWNRPAPHADFAADSAELLGKVRKDLARGVPLGDTFTNRELWSGTWKRRQQPKGLHKIQLAGFNRFEAKCAWCERLRDLSRELNVEHYRPKAKVSEWRGQYATTIDTPPPEHPLGTGYWWLAFAWDNYTLACDTCNQTWKRNLFPVRAPRPDCCEGVETQEIPLLIDPASDLFRTHEHFRWDILSGTIEGISEQGNATIITCGLNRKELVDARQKVALDTSQTVDALIRAIRREDRGCERKHLRKLARLGSMSSEFTSMTRWIAEQRLGPWDELPQLVE